MGDVGALGIGASLGMLAVTSNTQLLLPIIAGLQVMEIGSVALQMGTYRLSGRTRRLFKIAPVSEEMIWNYVATQCLGMPRGY